MKALVYEGPEQATLREVKKPVPSENQALIRVSYCGICGSDMGIYLGKHPRAKAPLVFGHEFVGVIEQINGESCGFQVGDYVSAYPLLSCGHCYACRTGREHVCDSLRLIGIDLDGGAAEYVCCDTNVLYGVSKKIAPEVAGIIEPFAVAIHAVHRSRLQVADNVAIIGAGPIGLLVALVCKQAGAKQIMISDILPDRLKRAAALGLDAVNSTEVDFVEYVKEKCGGVRADVVYECTGTAAGSQTMGFLCKTDGTVCQVGVHSKPDPVVLGDLLNRELNIVGTRVYTRRDFEQAVALLEPMEESLRQVISHITPLSEAQDVFRFVRNPAIDTAKVLLDCQK